MSDIVREFASFGYDQRIQSFDADTCSMVTPVDIMRNWREQGATTVFMAGTFDIPTPNHQLGLAEARLMGAASHLGYDYPSMHEGASRNDINTVMECAASSAVRLMVTLDTDERVAGSKAFKEEKGNCPRPILTWQTRAHNVASFAIPVPILFEASRHTVDFVTAHGLGACLVEHECMSGDNADMVTRLEPEIVVVNAASTHTVQRILELREKGEIPNTAIGLTNEQDTQFVDDLLGDRVSSTAIVRRIRQIDS